MKRLKYLFAAGLLLLALPIWRLNDWSILMLPFQIVTMVSQTIWAAFFIVLPLKLIQPKINKWMASGLICGFLGLSWLSGPLTSQTTLEPILNHCSRMSYTGFFYPARSLMTQAHQDDLEIRNQICWVIKLIKKVPASIPEEDLAHHLNLMRVKLLKPTIKYRATLPWITFLLGTYLTSSHIENSPLLIQNLGYWSNLYSEEVQGRDYAWYEWPHSEMVKFEYGLIERNWENIKLEFNSN